LAKDRRTTKLVGAARSVLAEMRASPDDPAKNPDAIAKRVAVHAQRRKAARAWEVENPGPYDRQAFERDVVPTLAEASLPRMMKATGLSSAYCWRIRRGDRLPHPMYWEALRRLAGSGEPSSPAAGDLVDDVPSRHEEPGGSEGARSSD
jgi:hypothetical protein